VQALAKEGRVESEKSIHAEAVDHAQDGEENRVSIRQRRSSPGIRASFGVASCPDHARDTQALFRLADVALYEAKRNGTGLQFVT